MSADRLSKETLTMKASLLFLSKLLEGEIIEEGMIYISIFLVLAEDIDFVFIPQECFFSTLDVS